MALAQTRAPVVLPRVILLQGILELFVLQLMLSALGASCHAQRNDDVKYAPIVRIAIGGI
jgi:hypothetical protein